MQVKEAWEIVERHGLHDAVTVEDCPLRRAYYVLCAYFESGMADDIDMEAPEE